MNKKNWSEEDFINKLKNMPEIKDTRSREEIFRNIEDRLHGKKSYKKTAWYLSIASSAAIIAFLTLFLPFNEPTIINENALPEDNKGNFIEDPAPLSQGNGSDDINSISIRQNDGGVLLSSSTLDYNGVVLGYTQSQYPVTISIPDAQAENLIPITLFIDRVEGMNEAERLNELTKVLNNNPSNVFDFMLSNAEFSEGNEHTLHVNVKENHNYDRGSASILLFYASIESILNYTKYDKVAFFTEGKEGIYLDSVGTIYELNEKSENIGYFLYQLPSTPKKYLVAIESNYDTLFETLQHMSIQNLNSDLKAIIPHGLIENVESNGEEAIITLNNEVSLGDINNSIVIIDAILMTAKAYGYEFVKFNGMSTKIGPYDLTERLAVPLRPNGVLN